MNSTLNPVHPTGTILLHRQQRDFTAAFCLVRGETPALLNHLPLLHPAERKYYDSLKLDRRRKSYLLGRIAAKTALSTLAGMEDPASFHIDFGVFDFPVVKGAALQNTQVTLSHCDDIAAALAFPEEHPLGLDLECINEERVDVMKTQMASGETDLLTNAGLPPAAGCTLAWTAKEALSKIFRTGLTMDLSLLEIGSVEKRGNMYTSTFRHCHQYKALSCEAGNYICTIVLPAKTTASLEVFWSFFTGLISGQGA